MSTLAYWLMFKTSSLWGLKDWETRVAYAYTKSASLLERRALLRVQLLLVRNNSIFISSTGDLTRIMLDNEGTAAIH